MSEPKIGRIAKALIPVWLVEMVNEDGEPVEWVLSVRDDSGGEPAWMSLTHEQFQRIVEEIDD